MVSSTNPDVVTAAINAPVVDVAVVAADVAAVAPRDEVADLKGVWKGVCFEPLSITAANATLARTNADLTAKLADTNGVCARVCASVCLCGDLFTMETFSTF
jgi:hypothetical protein